MVEEKTGRRLAIQGPIALDLDLTPTLVVENAALENASWGSHRNMVEVERLELELALLPLVRNKIQVKSVSLVGPKLFFETDASGRSNFRFQNSHSRTFSGDGKSASVFLGRIGVERGLFCYRGKTSQETVSVAVHRLQARQLELEERMELQVSGTCGSESFELEGSVGTIACLLNPEGAWPMDVRARLPEAEMHLAGSVRFSSIPEGLDLTFQLAGRSAGDIVRMLKAGSPELGPFRVEGELSGTKEDTWCVSNFTFTSETARGKGDLQFSVGSSGPEVRGWIALENLDVRSLFPERVAGTQERKTVFSSKRIPFGGLNANVEVEISAERIILPHTVLEGFRADVHAADTRFCALPVHFQAGGGKVEGVLEIAREGQSLRVSAQARASEMDLNLLFRDGRTQGRAEAEVDVIACGGSFADLMGSLDGRILIAIRGFRVENTYVNIIGSDIVTTLSRIFTPASTEATEIDCMVGGFAVSRGLATVTALVADTDEMVVMGRGRVDLGKEGLDLTITPYPKRGLAGVTLSFGGLTRSFKLGGTFTDPSLRVDPIQTVIALGKAVGGVFLMGPAGAALALAGQTAGNQDVCRAALEAARQGSPDGNEEDGTHEAGREVEGSREGLGAIQNSLEKLNGGFSSQPGLSVDVYGGGP